MPQIDTPILLDILLGLVILLFVPFGIRRGVAKEAMVSAGVLLGATLAEFQPQDDVRVYLDPAGHPFCLWVEG